MPRTGRPPKNTKMDSRLQIRADSDLMEKIEFCTEKTGKNMSEIVREGVEIIYRREKWKEDK